MSNASNAATKLGLIKETVFGVTPATPALIAQRFASATFTSSKSELTDDSKTGSRQRSFVMTGNETVTGSISAPFATDNYDTLLESAIYGTWTANVLKFGSTVRSLTVEEAQPDIGVYRSYRGTIVNGFNIDSPAEGLATCSFDTMSLAENIDTASIDADGNYTAQPARQPLTSCAGSIKEGGNVIGYVSSVSLSVNNNLSGAYAWGDCSVSDLVPGMVDVDGTLDVFFQSDELMNKFKTSEYSSLEFEMFDGTNTIKFFLPRIMYLTANSPVDAGQGQRMVSLGFKAVYDQTEGSTLVITRTP